MREQNDTGIADLFEDVDALAQPLIDPEKVLSDQELRESGMQKIHAYMRTKVSKSALRARKFKEQKAKDGLTSSTILVTPEVKPFLKEIQDRTQAKEPIESILSDLADKSITEEDRHILDVVHSGGIKARLIRLIAGR